MAPGETKAIITAIPWDELIVTRHPLTEPRQQIAASASAEYFASLPKTVQPQ